MWCYVVWCLVILGLAGSRWIPHATRPVLVSFRHVFQFNKIYLIYQKKLQVNHQFCKMLNDYGCSMIRTTDHLTLKQNPHIQKDELFCNLPCKEHVFSPTCLARIYRCELHYCLDKKQPLQKRPFITNLIKVIIDTNAETNH